MSNTGDTMKIKKGWITLAVILIVIVIAFFILNKNKSMVSEETAKCIGQNSLVYVQLGCYACATQEALFGGNYKYLNTIDCVYESAKCSEAQITATPTWIINDQRYVGVQSIEKLKELTNC